jgi:beta-lactamase superfamily II metal-dependent hydrolase
LLLLAAVVWPLSVVAADELEAHFISVGQADAILVRCPDTKTYMLIDSGDIRYPGSSKQFQEYLKKEFSGKTQRLSVAVASHVHADHTGSMKWVLENFAVGTYVDNGDKSEKAGWGQLEKLKNKLVKQGKMRYVNGKKVGAAEIDVCPGGSVTMDIMVPWTFGKLTDPNDRSVVVRLTHKNISFLFVGDAEDPAEAIMLTKMDDSLRKKLDVDVLKVGHHGSDTSSTMKFVMAVSPQVAVISSGEKNVGTNVRYKHPRFSTIDTYSSWFANADKGKSSPQHPDNGKVWAYDKDKNTWRQHVRPKGLWLTIADGTVIVKSDGNRVDVVTK